MAQGLSSSSSHAELREQVWRNTAARIANGDAFVLWAEEAFVIHGAEEESAVIARAKSLLMSSPLRSTYLGISYLRKSNEAKQGDNIFLLFDPDGHFAWQYAKSHPVPLIEADVKAGPSVLPLYDTQFGRVGGGICFDLDYPDFIRQAGANSVDILLQPSWTWSAISSRHFNGDALRAIENGMTIFRCSSDGESGVVGPTGVVYARQLTGHDPNVVVSFSVPLQKSVTTFFKQVGFAFNGVFAALACTIFVLLSFRCCSSAGADLGGSFLSSHRYRAMYGTGGDDESDPPPQDVESLARAISSLERAVSTLEKEKASAVVEGAGGGFSRVTDETGPQIELRGNPVVELSILPTAAGRRL
jgi:apolipoprotein N-acyltransferase